MITIKPRSRHLSWIPAIGIFLCSLMGLVSSAIAHVGVVNTQWSYAVAGKSYELVLTIPHGCSFTTAEGLPSEADTYKVEIAIPAGFTGVRPIVDGVFGRPAIVRDPQGVVTKLTWTKALAYDSPSDDQSYRIAVRGTVPNAPFTVLQFNTKQFCKNPTGGDDFLMDWSAYGTPASNQSPKVKIFPARSPGWNRYSLPSTGERHTPEAVSALLIDFFSDAQIVWLMPGSNSGSGAWSANTATLERIKALASKDLSTYEIVSNPMVMIHASDSLWVKF
jgi:hypothetical protein